MLKGGDKDDDQQDVVDDLGDPLLRVDRFGLTGFGKDLDQLVVDLGALEQPAKGSADDEGDDPANDQDHQRPHEIAGGSAHRAH